MALAKKDLENIGEVVEIKVSKGIGLLRLEMNQRFDAADTKNEAGNQAILRKIEEIKTNGI
ncbi:hypothetical protein A2V71_03370 [Candidatus Berkelbacteria bacterium RBG_13_40_8]|uniref:Uncharacterized protein n=1 Tax=Candidatus Berkelbacteria bacterium RBG_13_40_8 TaxID=1797467 RepID=A0A1F5DQJ8_9BACT|nr:MAG: hypothetical protein A2V71_03370 [Candidatus Berkelbacteria bacterium RBG_13_40_8]